MFTITVFTWLNATATITLVSKIGAATIQSRSPFDTGKQFLSHYFHNRLWAPLHAATNRGAASNQVNTVLVVIELCIGKIKGKLYITHGLH